MKVDVFTPEDHVGDVIGDLNRRRGMIAGQEAGVTGVRIKADVPLAEMFGYISTLRTMNLRSWSVLHGVLALLRVPGQRCRDRDRQGEREARCQIRLALLCAEKRLMPRIRRFFMGACYGTGQTSPHQISVRAQASARSPGIARASWAARRLALDSSR